MKDQIFFTVVDPIEDSESRINIDYDSERDYIIFDNRRIDKQQAYELGGLLMAIAGHGDQESLDEMLDGYGLT